MALIDQMKFAPFRCRLMGLVILSLGHQPCFTLRPPDGLWMTLPLPPPPSGVELNGSPGLSNKKKLLQFAATFVNGPLRGTTLIGWCLPAIEREAVH